MLVTIRMVEDMYPGNKHTLPLTPPPLTHVTTQAQSSKDWTGGNCRTWWPSPTIDKSGGTLSGAASITVILPNHRGWSRGNWLIDCRGVQLGPFLLWAHLICPSANKKISMTIFSKTTHNHRTNRATNQPTNQLTHQRNKNVFIFSCFM